MKLRVNALIAIIFLLGVFLPTTRPIPVDNGQQMPPHGPEIWTPVEVVETKKVDPIPQPELPEVKEIAPVPVETPPPTAAPSSGAGWHKAPCGVGANNKRAEIQAVVNQLGLGGDWTYIDYILGHESTWDPGCENAGGCRGLGQACPGSKLPCGPDDITCQVQWFHNYAMRAHGGTWASNYAFWLANRWW